MFDHQCVVLETPDPTIELLTGKNYSYAVMVIENGEQRVYATKLDKLSTEQLFNGWNNLELPRNIGVHLNALSAKTYVMLKDKYSVKDVSNEISMMRRHKTHEQVNCIMMAARCTDTILKEFAALPKGQITSEIDAKLWIENQMYQRGMEPAYPVIVASGKNSAIPHHIPTKEWNSGPVLIDAGAKYKGFCSDMTRMFDNGMTQQQKDEYTMLLGIQTHVLRMLKKGVSYAELHKFVQSALGRDKEYFTHSLGHGIGVEVHENPRVGLKSKDVIELGDVFTIEPGVYYENYGFRVEDTIFFDGEPRILTLHTKDLVPLFKP